MKKMVCILIVLFVTVISIGNFFIRDGVFMNFFYKEFDVTVNLVTKPEYSSATIKNMEKIAEKHGISFMKEEHATMNGRYGGQVINIYLYLHEDKWFKLAFKNISIIGNNKVENSFDKVSSIDIATRKDIRIKRYSDIDRNLVNGDYHLKGTESDIEKFVDDLNGSKKLNLDVKIVENPIIASDYTQKQFVLYISLVFILGLALLFCFVIYNNTLSKKLAISLLLGHKKIYLCSEKIIALMWLPAAISVAVQVLILYVLVNSDTISGYLFSIKKDIAITLLIFVCIFTAEFILLFIKVKNVNVLTYLKGYRKYFNKSLYVFRTLSVILTMSMVLICAFGFEEYIYLRGYINIWEKSSNYANIACAWPQSYIKDNSKFQEVVVPKLNNLWDKLDEEGAILFLAPNISGNEIAEDEQYLNSREFRGNYAYINSNYLNLAGIRDINGDDIEKYKLKSNEWIVFVPENMKIRDFDKKMIHKSHITQSVNKKNITERYVFVKRNQRVFSFDISKGVDNVGFQNIVLILIDGKEVLPNQSIKLPSLVNGNFHPYIDNPKKAYDSIKKIISSTHSDAFILYVNSVYSEVNWVVNERRIEAMVYAIGVLLSLIILITILKIDMETYFYRNGQRIYVSNLLGYKFVDIHRKQIIKNVSSYLIGILVTIWFIVKSLSYSAGWSLYNLVEAIVICICCCLTCFLLETFKLYNSDACIVHKLKEGC